MSFVPVSLLSLLNYIIYSGIKRYIMSLIIIEVPRVRYPNPKVPTKSRVHKVENLVTFRMALFNGWIKTLYYNTNTLAQAQ